MARSCLRCGQNFRKLSTYVNHLEQNQCKQDADLPDNDLTTERFKYDIKIKDKKIFKSKKKEITKNNNEKRPVEHATDNDASEAGGAAAAPLDEPSDGVLQAGVEQQLRAAKLPRGAAAACPQDQLKSQLIAEYYEFKYFEEQATKYRVDCGGNYPFQPGRENVETLLSQ